MTDLEKRKRLLVVEAEAYRESLRLEFQNLRIYGRNARRRAASLKVIGKVLLNGASLAQTFSGRKPRRSSRLGRVGAMVVLGWKLYNRLKPFLRGLTSSSRRAESEETPEEDFLKSRVE